MPGTCERSDPLSVGMGALAADLVRGMLAELDAFTRSAAPADDRTLVVVRRMG